MKTFGTMPDGRPVNKTPGQWHREQQERAQLAADPDVAKARREGSDDVKNALRRIAANGPAALDFALSVLDNPELTMEQIEKISAKIQPQSGTLLHRPRTASPVPAPRMGTREAEADWLKQARLAAEEQWNRAMGRPPQPDRRSAETIALHESFGKIAHEAAGLKYLDGQKRFRGDQADAELFQRGAEMAKKYWPGW